MPSSLSYLFISSFSQVKPDGKPTLPGHACSPTTSQPHFIPLDPVLEMLLALAVIKHPKQQLAMSSAKQILYYSTMGDSVYKTALPRRGFVNFTLKARFIIETVTQAQKPAQHLMPCQQRAKAKV